MGIINWYYYLSWQRNCEAEKRAKAEQDKANNKKNKSKANNVHPMQREQLADLQKSIEGLIDEYD